ncbi:MAG: photosynthetic reaction center cytochrome PufC [Lautropia sp.]
MKTIEPKIRSVRKPARASVATLIGLLASLALTGCERPPMTTTQTGYRGTGIVDVQNPRLEAATAALQIAPVPLPPAPAVGPKASQVYRNVKVLGDLSVTEFTRTMQAMTNWVSPEQGCNYCHNPADLAADDLYTKVVSRRMLEMTRHINGDWKPHVAATGVTCYTCHRGQPVPAAVWFDPPPQRQARGMARGKDGQNTPLPVVGLTSLPNEVLKHYLSAAEPIRVVSQTALPMTVKAVGMRPTEATYGLMFHMSESLGVNCTYCHNTRSFTAWDQGSPARVTAWHGIRMVQDLNKGWLGPLQSVYPGTRLGPLGDAPKANCLTCHRGASKPLNGAAMAGAYPGLSQPARP